MEQRKPFGTQLAGAAARCEHRRPATPAAGATARDAADGRPLPAAGKRLARRLKTSPRIMEDRTREGMVRIREAIENAALIFSVFASAAQDV